MQTSFPAPLLFAALLCSAQAAPLVDTDFGAPTLQVRSSKPETITGELPQGVLEDSAWADVMVKYSRQADRLGSDLKWIRAEVAEIRRGRVQLKWPLPQSAAAGGMVRLETTLGSDTGGRLLLRVAGQTPPYQILWEQPVALTPGRETRIFDFTLPASTPAPALLLIAEKPGEYDLYSVRMTLRSPEELAAERAAAVAAAPENLAPSGGFALGLPAGWSTGRRLSSKLDSKIGPGAEPGPHGTIPLRIEPVDPGVGVEIYSAPFSLPDPTQVYVLSFLAKGSGGGTVTVYADGKECGSGPFQATDEGALVRIPFRPMAGSLWNVIGWKTTGALSIDALNVSLGRQTKPFSLPDGMEIALAAAPEKANLFVEGVDFPSLRYALSGEVTGLTLRTRFTDLYGQSRDGASLLITDENRSGNLPFELPDAERPRGSFRAEAWAERDGKSVGRVAEVVFHVVPKPVYWGRVAPESKFGAHLHAYDPHLYAAKALGANWNRLHGGNGSPTYWSGVEPRKGEWKWHRDRLALYRDAGLAVCGVWVRVPGWARPTRNEADGWLDNWWQPRDLAEFSEYVRQSTTQYKDLVSAWQIWNEPWGEFWFKEWREDLKGNNRWHPGPTPREDFLALSKAAWETAHPLAPEMPVLGIDGTTGERGKSWMRKLLELGAQDYCNAISFHSYFGGDLAQVLDPKSEILASLESRVAAPIREIPAAAAMPLWMTEGGWLQRKADTGLHAHSVPGPKTALDAVRENCVKLPLYHALLFAEGVDKVFCYALNGGPDFFKPVPQGQIDWSSLVMPGGEIHPAGPAYATMAARFEKAEFVRKLRLAPDTLAFVFRNPDGRELIALFGRGLNGRLGGLGGDVVDFQGNPAKPGIVHQLLYVTVPEGGTAEQLPGIGTPPTP